MFAIIWSGLAFEQMDAIIKADPDRMEKLRGIIRIVNTVLGAAPTAAGESREHNRRVWFLDGLIVEYKVDLEDETVEITRFIPTRQL